MKTALLLLALASSTLAGQALLVKTTPEAIAKIQKNFAQVDPVHSAKAAPQATRPSGHSEIKQSLILHDGKNWTIIPRGAVVFVPETLTARVDAKPVGRLLPWVEFLSVNNSWINTKQISFDQAAGNEVITMERPAHGAKQDKVVVAIHQNGPISVNIAAGPQTASKE